MDIKLKEKYDVESYTFKKKVLEECIGLLGRKRNYVDNDIYFITMIVFCDNIVENNVIIDLLYENDKIEDKITSIIEPLFNKEVKGNPDNIKAFEEIIEEVKAYMEREYNFRLSLSGFLYDLLDDLGGLTMDDLNNIFATAMGVAKKKDKKEKKEETPEVVKSDEEIRKDALKDIQNEKMKVLIEQFTRAQKEKGNANK